MHTLLDEQQTELRDYVEENPRTSADYARQEFGLRREMTRSTLKDKGLHPCCVSMLQKLQPIDYDKRSHFCRLFKETFSENTDAMETVWFMDEAWFHQSSYVNAQN